MGFGAVGLVKQHIRLHFHRCRVKSGGSRIVLTQFARQALAFALKLCNEIGFKPDFLHCFGRNETAASSLISKGESAMS